ncbi:MAG: hypothetical protein ACXWW4_18660, partial [Candidatus Binatia bacterium]
IAAKNAKFAKKLLRNISRQDAKAQSLENVVSELGAFARVIRFRIPFLQSPDVYDIAIPSQFRRKLHGYIHGETGR